MQKLYFSKDDYKENKVIYVQNIPFSEVKRAIKQIGQAIKKRYGIKEKVEIPLDFIEFYTEKQIKDKDKVKYELVKHTLENIIIRYNKGNTTLVNKYGKYITKLDNVIKTVLIQDFIVQAIAYQIAQEYGQGRCIIKKHVDMLYDKVLEIL